jgi:hypothetical protein
VTCAHCGDPIARAATGRPPTYCSGRCRVAALRSRARASADPSGNRNAGTPWTIRKEFYADGPTMFVWVAERPGRREEFPRRRDAVAFARSN